MKKIIAFLMVIVIATTVIGCGSKSISTDDKGGDEEKTLELTVSGVTNTSQFLPVYICREKGWFKDAGLEVEEVLFTGGPVQMEAMASDSWDLGLTGLGGVLAGVVRYDGIVVNTNSTDDGGNYVFVRNDSDILDAGKGNNTINPDIIGSADTLKGKTVLTSTGTVLEYCLVKTLSGFGLTKDDVNILSMDGPTIYSSFTSGEGDIAVAGNSAGCFKFLAQDDEYTPISGARMAETGIVTSVVANPKSYENAEKFEAMKIFTREYFKATEWIKENQDEAADMMMEFGEECGSPIDLETARTFITADDYYTVEEAYKLATEPSKENKNISQLEYQLTNGLNFFISTGSYADSDKEIFSGCTDNKLIEAVYEEMSK